MSYWEELDDHLSWLEPTDLNLECVGVSHLDCVSRVLTDEEKARQMLLCEVQDSDQCQII